MGNATTLEIDFLKAKGCKLALMVRDLKEASVSCDNGTGDAQRAIATAKHFNVPQNKGIAIWADIQPDWSINPNWMLSFAKELSENGYLPGFLGNTDSSINFNFDRECSNFIQLSDDVDHYGALYGATEPKLSGRPKSWNPYCPSALDPESLSLWVCGKIFFCNLKVDEIYARDEVILNSMW